MKRWQMGCSGTAMAATLAVVGTWLSLHHTLPDGETGAAAESLARNIEQAVDLAAWEDTGAVRWSFAGSAHLWDRDRELYRLERGDRVVLLNLRNREGRAWSNGKELTGPARQDALEAAWSTWCNDAFWLNPLEKLRDPGTTLKSVDLPGEQGGLLVHFSGGGVTPGDSYLWIPGEGGRPMAWRMWVSIIPIQGIETSWEGWRQLDTGAWVSTEHALGPLTLTVDDVRGARSLTELLPKGSEDPFDALQGT
jgi:hypothetical protein